MLLTRSNMGTMFKKEKASSSSVSLKLMLPYLMEVAVTPYPFGYKVLKFQKFDGRKGDSKEHVASFLDSISHGITLSQRIFQIVD